MMNPGLFIKRRYSNINRPTAAYRILLENISDMYINHITYDQIKDPQGTYYPRIKKAVTEINFTFFSDIKKTRRSRITPEQITRYTDACINFVYTRSYIINQHGVWCAFTMTDILAALIYAVEVAGKKNMNIIKLASLIFAFRMTINRVIKPAFPSKINTDKESDEEASETDKIHENDRYTLNNPSFVRCVASIDRKTFRDYCYKLGVKVKVIPRRDIRGYTSYHEITNLNQLLKNLGAIKKNLDKYFSKHFKGEFQFAHIKIPRKLKIICKNYLLYYRDYSPYYLNVPPVRGLELVRSLKLTPLSLVYCQLHIINYELLLCLMTGDKKTKDYLSGLLPNQIDLINNLSCKKILAKFDNELAFKHQRVEPYNFIHELKVLSYNIPFHNNIKSDLSHFKQIMLVRDIIKRVSSNGLGIDTEALAAFINEKRRQKKEPGHTNYEQIHSLIKEGKKIKDELLVVNGSARLHGVFSSHGTATHRMKCAKYNLQGINKKLIKGIPDENLKSIIKVPDGGSIISADVSGQDIIVLVSLAKKIATYPGAYSKSIQHKIKTLSLQAKIDKTIETLSDEKNKRPLDLISGNIYENLENPSPLRNDLIKYLDLKRSMSPETIERTLREGIRNIVKTSFYTYLYGGGIKSFKSKHKITDIAGKGSKSELVKIFTETKSQLQINYPGIVETLEIFRSYSLNTDMSFPSLLNWQTVTFPIPYRESRFIANHRNYAIDKTSERDYWGEDEKGSIYTRGYSYPVQASGAEFIREWLLEISQYREIKIVNVIHDQIMFEIEDSDGEEYYKKIAVDTAKAAAERVGVIPEILHLDFK